MQNERRGTSTQGLLTRKEDDGEDLFSRRRRRGLFLLCKQSIAIHTHISGQRIRFLSAVLFSSSYQTSKTYKRSARQHTYTDSNLCRQVKVSHWLRTSTFNVTARGMMRGNDVQCRGKGLIRQPEYGIKGVD